jgi:SAM-dependent methyltransferase
VSDLDALRSFWALEFENWKARGGKEGYGAELVSVRMRTKIISEADVLEIGFGDGRQLELFASMGAKPYGIDILRKAASLVGRQGFPVCVGDARDLPFTDDLFDLTCSLGVFEHFQGTEKAVSEQIRVTKPGGRGIIALPHLYSPYTLVMALWHMLCGTWKWRPASYGKRFRKQEVLRLLEALPCSVIEIEPFHVGAICEVRPFRFLKGFLLQRVERNSLLRRLLGMMLWIEFIKTPERRMDMRSLGSHRQVA